MLYFVVLSVWSFVISIFVVVVVVVLYLFFVLAKELL